MSFSGSLGSTGSCFGALSGSADCAGVSCVFASFLASSGAFSVFGWLGFSTLGFSCVTLIGAGGVILPVFSKLCSKSTACSVLAPSSFNSSLHCSNDVY